MNHQCYQCVLDRALRRKKLIISPFFHQPQITFSKNVLVPEVLGQEIWVGMVDAHKIGFLGGVRTQFRARVLSSLAAEEASFRMRITLGVVLIRSLVFHVCVPECSRNGFGMRLYLLVREKFV